MSDEKIYKAMLWANTVLLGFSVGAMIHTAKTGQSGFFIVFLLHAIVFSVAISMNKDSLKYCK